MTLTYLEIGVRRSLGGFQIPSTHELTDCPGTTPPHPGTGRDMFSKQSEEREKGLSC